MIVFNNKSYFTSEGPEYFIIFNSFYNFSFYFVMSSQSIQNQLERLIYEYQGYYNPSLLNGPEFATYKDLCNFYKILKIKFIIKSDMFELMNSIKDNSIF